MKTICVHLGYRTRLVALQVVFLIYIAPKYEVKCEESTLQKYNIGFLPSRSLRHSIYLEGAVPCALEDFNSRPGRFENFTLDFVMERCKGGSHEAIRAMTAQHTGPENVTAFIGPDDSCAIEAHVASAWNIPMVAFKCPDSTLSDKKKFPTFTRTLPATSKVSKHIISVMKYYNWTSYTIIIRNIRVWKEAAQTLTDLATAHGIKSQEDQVLYVPFPYVLYRRKGAQQVQSLIDRTYTKTRIYVIMGCDDALIDMVRHINRAGWNSNGDYAVIAVQDLPYMPDNKGKYISHYLEESEITPEMEDAFRNVLLLLPKSPSNMTAYNNFRNRTYQLSMAPPLSAPPIPQDIKIGAVSIYAAFLYDAVMTYAEALNDALKAGISPYNGSAITELIRSRSYKSILGYGMIRYDNGDVEANYTVLALAKIEGKDSRAMLPAGEFTRGNGGIPVFKLINNNIKWLAGRPPASEPRCGFDGSECRFRPNGTVAAICSIAAGLIIIATIFACRHYLYEQKLASLLWKIDFKDLLMSEPEMEPTSEKTKSKRRHGRQKFWSVFHKDDLRIRKNNSCLSFFSAEDSSYSDSRTAKHTFTQVASYKGSLVAVRVLKRKHIEITRSMKKELQLLKEISHDNINRFVGASIEPPIICIVTQYCARGCLQDILENEDLHIDDMFIASLVFDLIKGMIFLHDSELVSHGNLKSSNCLVDSRWVLQIADFGLHQFKASDIPIILDEDKYYKRLLWKCPELLRDNNAPSRGTQKGDIYSFGVILYELHSRAGPWGPCAMSHKAILEKVKNPRDGWIFRPNTAQLKCDDFIIRCMQDCWQEEPELRPDFKFIRVRLKPMQRGLRSNIFDNMLAMMEKYATNLEALVEERTDQLVEEKKKTEALLHRMLPKPVAEQLKRGKPVQPEHYDVVTIYFSDIVGFTAIAAATTPMQVIDLLNELYTLFDSIIGEYDVYKVETIGDAYMVVSGLPIRNGDLHAGEIASMSLHLLSAIKNLRIRHSPEECLSLRIGVHSGSCVAGVVGLKMPRYCLFGDTVNTASRMESQGTALKIHVSPQCKAILDKLGGYKLEERGYVSLKGKGEIFSYYLLGEDKSIRLRRISTDVVPLAVPERRSCLRKQESTASTISWSDDEETDSPVQVLLNGSAHFINTSASERHRDEYV